MDIDHFSQFEELFWGVSRNMGYIWKRIFEKRFPGSQSYILFMLERAGPTRMSKLAEDLNLTPGAVTIASDKLIKQADIARIRDKNDRRVVYVDITEKGRQALNELRDEGRKTMKVVFGHLSEEELKHLITVFEKATEHIATIRKEHEK